MSNKKMLIYAIIILILIVAVVITKSGWLSKISINTPAAVRTIEIASSYRLHQTEHQSFVDKILNVNYIRSIKVSRDTTGKFTSEFRRCENKGSNSFDCSLKDEVSKSDQDYIYNFLQKYNYTTLEVTSSNGPEGYQSPDGKPWINIFIGNDSAMLQYSPSSKDLFTIDWRHETPKKIADHWFVTSYKKMPSDGILR
jgi:hypothetical protein